jgi:hypothetical protein
MAVLPSRTLNGRGLHDAIKTALSKKKYLITTFNQIIFDKSRKENHTGKGHIT